MTRLLHNICKWIWFHRIKERVLLPENSHQMHPTNQAPFKGAFSKASLNDPLLKFFYTDVLNVLVSKVVCFLFFFFCPSCIFCAAHAQGFKRKPKMHSALTMLLFWVESSGGSVGPLQGPFSRRERDELTGALLQQGRTLTLTLPPPFHLSSSRLRVLFTRERFELQSTWDIKQSKFALFSQYSFTEPKRKNWQCMFFPFCTEMEKWTKLFLFLFYSTRIGNSQFLTVPTGGKQNLSACSQSTPCWYLAAGTWFILRRDVLPSFKRFWLCLNSECAWSEVAV